MSLDNQRSGTNPPAGPARTAPIRVGALLVVLVGLAALAGTLLHRSWKPSAPAPSAVAPDRCAPRIEKRTVRGSSLAGLLEPGRTVKLLLGYYDCHPIERGDLVAYRHAGREEPIIKIVKGLPGDSFGLRPSGAGWNLWIDQRLVANSLGEPYLLDERGHRMLALYERDYRGSIPDHSYLLLGNLASGSLDSTRFGLVDKSELLAKVDY